MDNYNTLLEALDGLKAQGYTEDFNLKHNCLVCGAEQYQVLHDEFEVDHVYRFESNSSDPDEESVLYAISSSKHNLKGTLLSSFGIYAEPIAEEMIAKLRFLND